jgi:xylulose-5-phosphate/fructose-6-phosphate phosphoketolase
LSHAHGAAFDNPDLLVACVIGNGEGETGPLATAWHSNKFLNPIKRWRGVADPPLNMVVRNGVDLSSDRGRD